MPNQVIECPHCKGNTICRCGTCTNDRITIPSQCTICKGLGKVVILTPDDNKSEEGQLCPHCYQPVVFTSHKLIKKENADA